MYSQNNKEDDNYIYLLANQRHHKKRNINYSIDNEIFLLLQKKFSDLKITLDDYNHNIQKIEILFINTYNQKIINNIIDNIINSVINEQLLYEFYSS